MVSRSIRFGAVYKPTSALVLGAGLLVGAMFSGCGQPAPSMTEEEIKTKASEHDAKSKEMAAKYKRGPQGGHGAK